MTCTEAISKLNELIECTVDRYMIDDICDEIIEFLEAQEPRLVTESDFDSADEYGYIPVWTEEKDGDMYCECIPKIAITDPDGIGVVRYWTSRPSKEEMEAIPWN